MFKKFIYIVLAASMCCSCRTGQIPELLPADDFTGIVDGKPVSLYNLRAGDIYLQVTNFGGRVVSVFTPDKNGSYQDIVVGQPTIGKYVNTSERFLGACVGPVANRIGGACFTIDGVTYNVPSNDNGVNTLHGGEKGLDMVVWDVLEADENHITLHYLHKDGQEGFPGNKDITMTYSVTPGNEFVISYKATTDRPSPINISNHPFFCLNGEANGSVEDYLMKVNASFFIPIDSLSIPTGEIADVTGTPFDFRVEHRIGDRIADDNIQLKNAGGYDHNWCIDRKTEDGIEFMCSVFDPESGRQIEVFSDQPGLQIYSGNFFDGSGTGKAGRPLGFRSSIALETQHYPDSPNHPEFPSVIFRPGESYHHTCIYRFSVRK